MEVLLQPAFKYISSIVNTKVLVNLKRIKRWPYNKEMDISYLVKQASNHEQTIKKREFHPKEKRHQTTKTESSYWEKISL
jgi:hypothetical protein